MHDSWAKQIHKFMNAPPAQPRIEHNLRLSPAGGTHARMRYGKAISQANVPQCVRKRHMQKYTRAEGTNAWMQPLPKG